MTNVVQQVVRVDPLGRVSRKEAAKALNKKPKTLCEWGAKGIGPRPFAVGGRIFYWWSEVAAYGRGEK
jgi:hypothetical protein